jgi:hypothetical protein
MAVGSQEECVHTGICAWYATLETIYIFEAQTSCRLHDDGFDSVDLREQDLQVRLCG